LNGVASGFAETTDAAIRLLTATSTSKAAATADFRLFIVFFSSAVGE